MESSTPIRVRSITEGHRAFGLSKPEHPLISVVSYAGLQLPKGTP